MKEAVRDTHEIVVNWDDGRNVYVECVPYAALVRTTRKFDAIALAVIADLSTRVE